jgi:hypothetical protein
MVHGLTNTLTWMSWQNTVFCGTLNQYSSLKQATNTRRNRTEYVDTLATVFTILTLYQQLDYVFETSQTFRLNKWNSRYKFRRATGIAQSVLWLSCSLDNRGSIVGLHSRLRDLSVLQSYNRLWGPPSFLYKNTGGSFSWVNWFDRHVEYTCPSDSELSEMLES